MESCYERTSRWQCWSGVPAKWPLWFQSLLRGAAHISIVVSSIFGSSTASFILFQRFWATFPRVFSRFLSSLLRYTQPYGRATITFSFRQFSLFSLHQSYWSTMMQLTLSLSLSTVRYYILPWVITWLPVDNKFRHSSVWVPGPFTRPSALVSHTSRHEGIISDAFL